MNERSDFMSYITYVESKDGTKLYTKVNRS